MLKEEIIEKISKYFKLTTFEAEKIYNDIFSIIASGVKKDNIVDVANFGEFIIKYNNGNSDAGNTAYKKTVEFLATSKLEDEINQGNIEPDNFSPSVLETVPVNLQTTQKITDSEIKEVPAKNIQEIVLKETTETKKSSTEAFEKTEGSLSSNPIEEEMKRKREEILQRISKPADELFKPSKESLKKVEEVTKTTEKVQTTVPVSGLMDTTTETVEKKTEELKKSEEKEELIKPEPIVAKKTEEIEDLSQKTFADYFTEVNEETKTPPLEKTEKIEEPVQNVIPPSVVELHNEITNTPQHETMTFPTVETVEHGTGSTNGNGISTGEYRASDNSYYIWYKDVEANATETQNLSYEYELLYQATKEAEYKSKLKIYVTTFILFFSIVLVLLIFSPVIYKIFFKPVETPKTENVEEQPSSSNSNEQQLNQNKAEQNVLTEQNTGSNVQNQNQEQGNNNVVPSPVANEQQNNNQQPQNTEQQSKPTEQPQQQTTQQQSTQPQQTQTQQQTSQPPQQQTQTQQNPEPKLDGVTKNSMGWMDDKLKVIYVKLDNGKYTIQESAWDSDAKASKRISTVSAYNIGGLSGTVFKVDLGDKGTWFRARFGEFASLEEAKAKAEELRNKERMKFQAALLLFLLYA